MNSSLVAPLEKITTELCPAACDYIRTLRESNLLLWYSDEEQHVERASLEEGLKKALEHEFTFKINKQPNFMIAKKRLIDAGLVKINLDEMSEPCDFLNAIALEFTCANILASHFSTSELIKKIVVPQKKIDAVKIKADKIIKQIKSIDGFFFESEYEQHLYVHLTRKLLSSKESVFNAGKMHNQLFREFFIKKCIQLLYSIFNRYQKSTSFFADTAISLASVFFLAEMDRGDCIDLSEKIIKRVNNDLVLMQTTVGSWFYDSSQELLHPENPA